uniref:Uncharacterized protein n=1 Tax=Tanacetum cinerariifolium TaxID=118510 RepID=A0A699ISI3_TANCI|nr:hypothetical protein [Tanacetum cinerariifolium]
MEFGGNIRNLGSFREEIDEIIDLHQIHEEILFLEHGNGVAGIKRRRRDPSSDDVRDLVTTLRRGRLKEDLESSTWRRHHDYNATPEPFTRSPNMYKEYPTEFWYSAKALANSKFSFYVPTGGIYGKVRVNTFRNTIGAHYLPYSGEFVAPPSIDIIRPGFEIIEYEEIVPTKGTLKKSLLPPSATEPVVFNAPKPSSNAKRVPQGIKPEVKPKHKKHSTSSKQSMSSKEATKCGSSKAPTGSKTDHAKKRKERSLAMDSNPSQPPVSTRIDSRMHKEDRQETGGPTSLGVTSEERANLQLSSGMLAFNLNKLIYSTSFIIHSESASGNDASAVSIAEADLGNSAPSNFIPQQQCMNEETKITSYDHLFAVEEEESSSTIKLEDLAKLVSNVQPSFKDLDLPEDDPVIIVDDSDEDEEDEVHTNTNDEAEDTSVPTSSSPRTTQCASSRVFTTEFLNILSAHDFSSSLPIELKDLPFKFNGLTKEVKGLKKQVHELEIELPGDLKEIPTKMEDFTKNVTSLTSQVAELKNLQWELPTEFLLPPMQVASVQAKLKTFDALPGLW